MRSARDRLVALGVAQAARALADGCLAGILVIRLVGLEAAGDDSFAGSVVLTVLVTWTLVAPCAGVLADRRGARRVFLAGSVVAGAAALLVAVAPTPVLAPAAILTAGAALSGAARETLLAPAARNAGWPLPRVVATMRSGAAAAAAGGLLLAQPVPHHNAGGPASPGTLLPVGIALAANLLALLVARPAGPVLAEARATTPVPAGGRLLREGRRLAAHPDSLDPLLALAGLAGVALASGAVAFGSPPASWDADTVLRLLRGLCLGWAAGSLLAAGQTHPSRGLCVVPLAVTGLLAALLWRAHAGAAADGSGTALVLGTTAALAAVPLSASYLTYLPADARGHGVAWLNLAAGLFAAVALALVLALGRLGVLAGPAGRLGFLGLLAAVSAAGVWWAFFRDFAERVVELLLRPGYRVRAHGPGLPVFPLRGPVLVLANHAAWLDALWVATVLPRRAIPLMISLFYDRPVLHWLMSRVIRAIRVEDAPYRHEAPELAEAVAALDRGDCVLMFPEGYLRRKDEVPLRHFGQGVWRILRDRPATPVVVCWIEGGWGSLTSHDRGPPLTGKPLDWRRPIDIAVEPPQVLDPALLADQRATRHYLEQACLEARRHLGLEVPSRDPATGEP